MCGAMHVSGNALQSSYTYIHIHIFLHVHIYIYIYIYICCIVWCDACVGQPGGCSWTHRRILSCILNVKFNTHGKKHIVGESVFLKTVFFYAYMHICICEDPAEHVVWGGYD